MVCDRAASILERAFPTIGPTPFPSPVAVRALPQRWINGRIDGKGKHLVIGGDQGLVAYIDLEQA